MVTFIKLSVFNLLVRVIMISAPSCSVCCRHLEWWAVLSASLKDRFLMLRNFRRIFFSFFFQRPRQGFRDEYFLKKRFFWMFIHFLRFWSTLTNALNLMYTSTRRRGPSWLKRAMPIDNLRIQSRQPSGEDEKGLWVRRPTQYRCIRRSAQMLLTCY